MTANEEHDDNSNYEFAYSKDFHVFSSSKRLSRETIEEMSRLRGEPYWMREFRLRSYDKFMSKPTPNWGCDLSKIDFHNIYCHATTSQKGGKKSGGIMFQNPLETCLALSELQKQKDGNS